MSSPRPFFICCQPRTGSSMVTACLMANGMWVGEKTTLGTSRFGNYSSWENQHIKAWLKPWWQAKGTNGVMATVSHDVLAGFKSFLEAVIDGREGWGFKTIPELWPFFADYAPVIVCVRRKYENAVASALDKGKNTISEGEVHAMVQARMRLMADLIKQGGHWVDADRVVTGDVEQIRAVCEAGGLDFEEPRTQRMIQPDRWHFK